MHCDSMTHRRVPKRSKNIPPWRDYEITYGYVNESVYLANHIFSAE
jgi:hypothetical protein